MLDSVAAPEHGFLKKTRQGIGRRVPGRNLNQDRLLLPAMRTKVSNPCQKNEGATSGFPEGGIGRPGVQIRGATRNQQPYFRYSTVGGERGLDRHSGLRKKKTGPGGPGKSPQGVHTEKKFDYSRG